MSDTERLREIAYAAKAHWGYDRELVRTWADSFEPPPDENLLLEDGGAVGRARRVGPGLGTRL